MQSQTEAVRQFLAAQDGYVCVACAASTLDLGIRPVAMIVFGLVRSDGFEATEEVCRLCRGHGRVVRGREPPAARGDSGKSDAVPQEARVSRGLR
jgi:hypothetical protein